MSDTISTPEGHPTGGMSFRDYTAIAILHALVSRGSLKGDRVKDALSAYEYADAMLEARNYKENNAAGQKKVSSEKTR
jgi:hypothetical protein